MPPMFFFCFFYIKLALLLKLVSVAKIIGKQLCGSDCTADESVSLPYNSIKLSFISTAVFNNGLCHKAEFTEIYKYNFIITELLQITFSSIKSFPSHRPNCNVKHSQGQTDVVSMTPNVISTTPFIFSFSLSIWSYLLCCSFCPHYFYPEDFQRKEFFCTLHCKHSRQQCDKWPWWHLKALLHLQYNNIITL